MSESVVGNRIKQARVKALLTQEGLADLVSAHKFTVSKWERGETSPGKPSDYVAIAKACNVSHEWLKNGVGSVNDPYAPVYEEGRRHRESQTSVSGFFGSGKTNSWLVIANLMSMIVEQERSIKPERLAKVLELGCAMAERAPLDNQLVATILRMVS
jgi:DNA-binding XRE family transcriptional regulator